MHNEPRLQLCQIIAHYGSSLAEDPRRCSALLKDFCSQYKREILELAASPSGAAGDASAGKP